MAIVIRFNTIIVRKLSITAKYPGGLNPYRSLYLPKGANLYYEDHYLIAHTSMGAFDGVVDCLMANGIGQDSDSADYYCANQTAGIDPMCQWLKADIVAGHPVCWHSHSPPGFVSDFKSRRFVRRVSESSCSNCAAPLGLGEAAEAVDKSEWEHGPLSVVHENPSLVVAVYVVWCLNCKHEMLFTDDGELVENSE